MKKIFVGIGIIVFAYISLFVLGKNFLFLQRSFPWIPLYFIFNIIGFVLIWSGIINKLSLNKWIKGVILFVLSFVSILILDAIIFGGIGT